MKITFKRRALLSSFISILICLIAFTSATFAWFSDSVTSADNIITVGNLDAEMYWSNDITSNDWHNIEDKKYNAVFTHDNYEPGYTELKYLKIVNTGSLSFKYDLSLLPIGKVGKLAEVVDVYYMSDVTSKVSTRGLLDSNNKGTIEKTLGKSLSGTKVLLPRNTYDGQHTTYETIVAIALKMQTTAGNEYQGQSIGDGFSIRLKATQYSYEEDSFDEEYDKEATWPDDVTLSDDVTKVAVENVGNKVAKAVTMVSKKGDVSANIPAGVSLEPGTEELALSVTAVDESNANISFDETEAMLSMDVHIEGVADDNEVVMEISLGAILPKGLNLGNYRFYHVEDKTYQMRLLGENETPVHNSFKYDPQTGNVIVYLKSFSEIAAVADTENAWKGEFDYSWYTNVVLPVNDTTEVEYIIANADQLAAFGAIVGGMDGQTRDDFEGKTVKLIADINLGDAEDNNNPDLIFYPIGYYNSTGSFDKVSGGDVKSNVSSFSGTFNGNGHTISNFYQNTWEMFGDYNSGYSGTPNHYKDAMGLFGYVNGGTITNLHVKNFSSDGEFTPTGVIAAYAVNSTFKNIAITYCNPRVYNTGNGGIVGIAGNDNDESSNMLFKNITVDNTNKISALWGSWDVACGGLIGMYRGTSEISFNNCHVAAQIDVYNDVCGNYQYYWYRYSGMMIGSIKKMTTDADGYTTPYTEMISAEECTVHFGDWNNYYYCELVANSLASYTHDHQFSRLTEVKSVDLENKIITPLEGEAYPVPTSGRYNYVVVTEKDETKKVTCYHFVNGEVWDHEDAGTETVNGETVLKEDKQHIYLPFNQVFQGYGWGVKHIPVYNGDDYAFKGITILDREIADSETKFIFTGNQEYAENGYYKFDSEFKYTIGSLFSQSPNLSTDEEGKICNQIISNNVRVTVSPVEGSNVYGVHNYENINNWTEGTLVLYGTGAATITITDYKYCTPTTINIVVNETPKFKTNFVNYKTYRYRVGNNGDISFGTLFSAVDDNFIIDSDKVELECIIEEGSALKASVTHDPSDWTKGIIKFTNTGIVKLSLKEKNKLQFELELEVVDAVNAIGASNATTNNVVLLNDCGFSSLEVSGGYTLYGNGFTMTCGSDSAALDMGYAFVTLDNGTLDNVQIVTPNFDYAVLYKSNMTESGNRSETTDKTRYYNVKSGVMVSGNSQILNSRISGARAAVNVAGGNVLIDNSRIEGGAVASILVGAANSVTLRDVTLVQKPISSTHDSSKTLMGFSVLYLCDSEGNAAHTTLEGTLVQYAWANADDKQYVPSAGQGIVDAVMKETAFIHNIDGKNSVNLGFAYMPEDAQKTVAEPDNIEDNRSDKDTIPYEMKDVKIQLSILSTTVYVYSYKNTNGTDDTFRTEPEYTPNKYSDIITVSYSDTVDGLTTGKSLGTNGWVYELNVDLDKLSGYVLDFSKLSMSINGTSVTDYQVNGNTKPTSPVAVQSGGTTYTLTATVDGKEYTATYKVTGTETSKDSPSLVASNYEAGLCVASSYGGTWHGAAPALQGIQIRYWSVAEKQYKTINLSDYTPTTKGQLNGTNTTWTYSPANGDFTLTLTGGQVHSSNNVYAMPVVCDGKLYFVAAKSTGLVNSGNSARTIPVSYTFKDNNNGDVLTFSHTWSVAENKDAQYKYSDFCNGTLTKLEASSGGGTCITPESLITLADGSQVRVDSLVGNEQLLVWNLETGKLDSAPIMFIDNDPVANYKVVNLHFSDDTIVKVIYEHGFWDYNLGKYIYLDENASEYIGHWFAKQNGDSLEKVQLVDVVIEEEMTSAWSPVTVGHLCYFVNGMLSMPGGVEGLFNIFDVNPETMTYDYEAMQRDIETYGLFTYEEVNEIAPLSREMFEQCGGAYLKVSIGKGNMTIDDLIYMIERYKNFYTSLVALGLVL